MPSLSRAALIAFTVEAAVVGGAFLSMSHSDAGTQAQGRPVVMLSMADVAAPQPKPPTPHHEHRHHTQPPKPQATPPQPPTEPVQQPAAVQAPPVVASAAPDPAPAAATAAVGDIFRGKVRAAVQSAVDYPYAAQQAHITGKAQVAFHYRDATVSSPQIVISSGYDMLDSAALAAVSSAHYPLPPKELSGKDLDFAVWVRFYQTDASE